MTDIFDIQICGKDYPPEYVDSLVDSVAALQFLLRSRPHLANFIESEEDADRDDIGKTLSRVEEILNVASPASAIAAVQSSFDNSLEEGYEYGYAFEWMLDTARTDGRKLKVWQLSHIFFSLRFLQKEYCSLPLLPCFGLRPSKCFLS